MQEFGYVVLAGTAIFLIAGIIAGLPNLQVEEDLESKVFFSEDFGSVGNVNTSFRRIRLPDMTIGSTRGNKTVEYIEEVELKNGFTSNKDRTIQFNAEDPKKAYLSFEVYNTNLYGTLDVYANGEKVISSKMMTGITPELTIKGENLKKGENVIEIKAGSPGLKFWAPNTYILKDVTLKANDYGRFELSKSFRVFEYEMRGFSRGQVKFFVEESIRENDLNVEINGRNVYKDKPMKRPLPYKIRFFANHTQLRPGENHLRIWSENGSEYNLDNSDLKIFYYGAPERTTIQRDFEISDSQYRALQSEENRGVMKFKGKVYVPDKLEISMENETFNFYPETGENKFYFNQTAVKEGTNSLRLETEGSLEIQNFKVMVQENEE